MATTPSWLRPASTGIAAFRAPCASPGEQHRIADEAACSRSGCRLRGASALSAESSSHASGNSHRRGAVRPLGFSLVYASIASEGILRLGGETHSLLDVTRAP